MHITCVYSICAHLCGYVCVCSVGHLTVEIGQKCVKREVCDVLLY